MTTLTGLKTSDFVKSKQLEPLGDTGEMSAHHRSRRAAVTLTDGEKATIVDKHNELRRLAGASDMLYMVSAIHFYSL